MKPFAAACIAVALVAGAAAAATPEQEARARACGVAESAISRATDLAPVLARLDETVTFTSRGDGGFRVVEFTDYSCPNCRAVHPRMIAFAAQNPDVRVDLVELPIYGRTIVSRVTGNKTLDASRIALAARAQDKHLAFHDALMTTSGGVRAGTIREAAEKAGLDLDAAAARAEDEEIAAQVEANLAFGQEIGVRGVPVILAGGVFLSPRDFEEKIACLMAADGA